MKINKLYLFLRAIPKTIYFNFHYLPFRQALRFPILISHRVILKRTAGNIAINSSACHSGMIRIGFHENSAYDQRHNHAVWNVTGNVSFDGSAHIGNGSVIVCDGQLSMGDQIVISGNSVIRCYDSIRLGNHCLISDRCLIQDGDNHQITDFSGTEQPITSPIQIEEHVWLATGCSILKGVHIPCGCVIGYGTLLVKSVTASHAVIAGCPPRILKDNIRWQI